MSKIHLHIDHLSLPGYTPAERRAFIAALEQELAASAIAGKTSLPRHASREAVCVTSQDLRPQSMARSAVLGLSPGTGNGKEAGK